MIRERIESDPPCNRIAIVSLEGELFFGSAPDLEKHFESIAQRVEVEPGAVEGGFVEILSGVTAGDRMVASGLNRIQPGSPVTTGPARATAPAAGPAAKGAPQ